MNTEKENTFKTILISEAQIFLRSGEIRPALNERLDYFKKQFGGNLSNLEALELLLDHLERN